MVSEKQISDCGSAGKTGLSVGLGGDGFSARFIVGAFEGAPDGWKVAPRVGRDVGTGEGSSFGPDVGNPVGVCVGVCVGAKEGLGVGRAGGFVLGSVLCSTFLLFGRHPNMASKKQPDTMLGWKLGGKLRRDDGLALGPTVDGTSLGGLVVDDGSVWLAVTLGRSIGPSKGELVGDDERDWLVELPLGRRARNTITPTTTTKSTPITIQQYFFRISHVLVLSFIFFWISDADCILVAAVVAVAAGGSSQSSVSCSGMAVMLALSSTPSVL